MLTFRSLSCSVLCALVVPPALLGCATAVDDGLGVYTGGDASPYDARIYDAGGDTTVGTDAARSDSVTTGVDTRSGTDTATGADTAVGEDTYVEPADTEPPPTDTYVPPTGGPCGWCAEGSCDTPDEDLSCFEKCVIFGSHWDCRYDKSMSPVCLCTD